MLSGCDWSFTKSSTYAACPRAFHFSRELAKGVNAPNPVLPPGGAISISALVGVAVHQSIADQIAKWAFGQRLSLREAQAMAEGFLDQSWSNPKEHIIDAANGLELAAGSLARMIAHTRSLLHTFVSLIWPRLSTHTYVLHETTGSFALSNIRVSVKVDLCTRSPDGELTISDWKTGRPSVLSDDKLQMSIYALWASHEYALEPTDVRVQKANLRTGEIVGHTASSLQLEQSTSRVEQECKDWASASAAQFPARPDVLRCSSCRYLVACTEGQAATRTRRRLET